MIKIITNINKAIIPAIHILSKLSPTSLIDSKVSSDLSFGIVNLFLFYLPFFPTTSPSKQHIMLGQNF